MSIYAKILVYTNVGWNKTHKQYFQGSDWRKTQPRMVTTIFQFHSWIKKCFFPETYFVTIIYSKNYVMYCSPLKKSTMGLNPYDHETLTNAQKILLT